MLAARPAVDAKETVVFVALSDSAVVFPESVHDVLLSDEYYRAE